LKNFLPASAAALLLVSPALADQTMPGSAAGVASSNSASSAGAQSADRQRQPQGQGESEPQPPDNRTSPLASPAGNSAAQVAGPQSPAKTDSPRKAQLLLEWIFLPILAVPAVVLGPRK
jgi:hypothetical protein